MTDNLTDEALDEWRGRIRDYVCELFDVAPEVLDMTEQEFHEWIHA